VGSRKDEVNAAIARSRRQLEKSHVSVTMRLKDDKIFVDLGDAPETLKERKGKLWLAIVEQKIRVLIKRGENHGQRVTYFNVVRALKPIGGWNGKAVTLQFNKSDFLMKDSDGCAIILQQGNTGPIIGAAELKSLL
jgi:hypothetical protein